MRQNFIRDQRNYSRFNLKKVEWLLYIPGAVIIAYGFWLSLIAA